VKEAVTPGKNIETFRENLGFEKILDSMIGSSQQDFSVVDREGNLVGIISMTDLRTAMANPSIYRFLIAKKIWRLAVL